MTPGPALVALRCRTSDRSDAPVRGVDLLAQRLARGLRAPARPIGSPSAPRIAGWEDDLADARGCLMEAGGQVDDALEAGALPVLLAGECAIALGTLPVVARRRPDVRILWLDGHADFNTPSSTPSGYLSGMSLSGACGQWETGFAGGVPPERVVLCGVRDVDEAERGLLERSEVTAIGASLETLVATQNALDRAPVYVHLDLDVIDPDAFPAEFPAPRGLTPEKLYDLLEAVASECELVGLEITSFAAPADELEAAAAADTAARAVEPLLDAAASGAHAVR